MKGKKTSHIGKLNATCRVFFINDSCNSMLMPCYSTFTCSLSDVVAKPLDSASVYVQQIENSLEGEAMPSFDEWKQKEQEKSKSADGKHFVLAVLD